MPKHILHTEASPGWGGQEMRILAEAQGLRKRGYEIVFAVREGGGLVEPARKVGFEVKELPFVRSQMVTDFFKLLKIIRTYSIEIVNTHSSIDAWVAGLAGKLSGCRVIRTRHLSTPIKRGLNSRLLYNWLADAVVTTCQAVVPTIERQARLKPGRCRSIPTGVNPEHLHVKPSDIAAFRQAHGLKETDIVAGTLCVMRGWKGVSDLLHAASQLKAVPNLKWLVVGGGVSLGHFKNEWRALGLQDKVIFTDHLSPPYTALAAMDLFLLLSWANEGVSQSSLQAGWLAKPLITTPVGGLPEVCLDGKTGLIVPIRSPKEVAAAVLKLTRDPTLRTTYGQAAHTHVSTHFTLDHTLDAMEEVIKKVSGY